MLTVQFQEAENISPTVNSQQKDVIIYISMDLKSSRERLYSLQRKNPQKSLTIFILSAKFKAQIPLLISFYPPLVRNQSLLKFSSCYCLINNKMMSLLNRCLRMMAFSKGSISLAAAALD